MEDTVYKNLEDAAKLYGPSELADHPELRKEEVLSVLKKLDLESVKGSKCSSLSGGQKKTHDSHGISRAPKSSLWMSRIPVSMEAWLWRS